MTDSDEDVKFLDQMAVLIKEHPPEALAMALAVQTAYIHRDDPQFSHETFEVPEIDGHSYEVSVIRKPTGAHDAPETKQ